MSDPTATDLRSGVIRPQEVDLAITGMTCASCAVRIERSLNTLDRVEASVNLATEKAGVRYASRPSRSRTWSGRCSAAGAPLGLCLTAMPTARRPWRTVAAPSRRADRTKPTRTVPGPVKPPVQALGWSTNLWNEGFVGRARGRSDGDSCQMVTPVRW